MNVSKKASEIVADISKVAVLTELQARFIYFLIINQLAEFATEDKEEVEQIVKYISSIIPKEMVEE